MTRLFIVLVMTAGVASLSSCVGTRTVYLGGDTTRTVRLRETVKGVDVWVKDSTGTSIPAKADLLEGGYYRNDLQ